MPPVPYDARVPNDDLAPIPRCSTVTSSFSAFEISRISSDVL